MEPKLFETSFETYLLWYSFKWQYMAGAGAGAKIFVQGGAEKEPDPKFWTNVEPKRSRSRIFGSRRSRKGAGAEILDQGGAGAEI